MVNATTSAYGAIGTQGFGWGITLFVFLAVIGTIFLLSKNFRQFVYGAVVSLFLLINYKLSRWIGVEAGSSNFAPLKWTIYIIGFVVVSIVIGKFVQKLKFIKKLESGINE